MIEKKTQAALTATQDKNRISNEIGELRDQVDIKERKVNVLQRKVSQRENIGAIYQKWHCSMCNVN